MTNTDWDASEEEVNWDYDPDDEDWGEQEGDDMSETKIVSTEEEGIEALRSFIRDRKFGERVCHALLARDNETGELKAVLKPSRPCYGELRRYGKESTRPGDHKPSDLTQPIDFDYRGLAIAIPFNFTSYAVTTDEKQKALNLNLIASTLLDEDVSPWRLALKGREIVYDADGNAKGFIAKDPDIDSTWIVSLAMNLRYFAPHPHRVDFFRKTYEVLGVPLAYLMSYGANTYKKTAYYTPPEEGEFWGIDSFDTSYHLDPWTPLGNFLSGRLTHLNPGNFSEGYDYNRPQLSMAFYTPGESHLATEGATAQWVRDYIATKPKMMGSQVGEILNKIGLEMSAPWSKEGLHLFRTEEIIAHAKEFKDASSDWL